MNMTLIQVSLENIKDYLMYLWKLEINQKILEESSIGKTLKYFFDYCVAYEDDLVELRRYKQLAQSILEKWKNYMNNHVFDYI